LQPAAPDRRHADRRQDLPDALDTCATFISRHFRGEVSEQAMHDAVRRFGRYTQRCGIPPERALAQLKVAILHVPEVSARPAMERGELLRVLVQDAIRAYYSEPGDSVTPM
jgi:hypothetical protein